MNAHPFDLALLACTVRGCGRPLASRGAALGCERAHVFDRSRAGHVNLLQPQDRRSAVPGDAPEAWRARERWFERGHAAALLEVLRARAAAAPAGAWLDLCCGSGSFLRALAPRASAFGLDLSAGAIERAARCDPSRGWVVANADRGLPFVDGSLALVLAVQARLPEPELARVLRAGGRALVVAPGARDLCELRERVLSDARPLAHAARARASFGAGWRVLHEQELEVRVACDRAALADALALSYRGQRAREAARLAELEELQLTQAWHVLELERC